MRKFFIAIALFFTSIFTFSQANAVTLADYNLEKYQGNTVLIDFWASWCGPCRESFPWMNQMYKKYKDQGLVVLAINVDEEKSNAETFLKTNPAEFAIMYDPKGKLAEAFKVPGMPSSYLFDTSGNLVNTHKGFKASKSAEYEENIRKALLGGR